LGATASKFGIYYGRTKSNAAKKYRATAKFSGGPEVAFAKIKSALLELIDAGRTLKFEAIDANPLSQMFKAKILSLYFPEKYFNVCSAEHIELLSEELGLPFDTYVSEQQHQLLQAKLRNPITRIWSNPKMMTFLYNTYIRSEPMHVKERRERKHAKIDIEDLLEQRKRIGELSEKFAKAWERKRLVGKGVAHVRIDDCRETPACGYDFLSCPGSNDRRFIEVKTAGRNRLEKGFRFFLSETEYKVSKQLDHRERYYFYLVFYKDKKPNSVRVRRAADVYETCTFSSNGYIISLDEAEPD